MFRKLLKRVVPDYNTKSGFYFQTFKCPSDLNSFVKIFAWDERAHSELMGNSAFSYELPLFYLYSCQVSSPGVFLFKNCPLV